MQVQPCDHRGEPVSVGPYTVWAGSYRLDPEVVAESDLLVMLGERLPWPMGQVNPVPIMSLQLPDFGGVTADWDKILVSSVIPQLEADKRLTFFCLGGHGRTGTALASLVALLEPQTADPIAAVRKRYCPGAVETPAQAAGIFDLRGETPPWKYMMQRRH